MLSRQNCARLFFWMSIVLGLALIKNARADEGKTIFLSKCAKCHNVNPTKPGSIGPDIADSSLELVRLKTQNRSYPAGYTPKRKTRVMPIVKLSESQIKAVHSYISSFKKSKTR